MIFLCRRAALSAALALCVCAMPLRATAQSAPSSDTLKAASDLMAIMNVDTVRQMVTGMTNQLWPTIERDLRTKKPDITQAILAELRKEFEDIQMKYMADVMSEAPTIYARHFTAAELRDMLAFYKTPTGQKALKEMPTLMTEVFAMIMPKIQSVQGQILESFNAVLRQRGINL